MNLGGRAAGSRVTGRILQLLAVCWILTTAVPSLYGKGSQDPDLSRADALIKEKNYNEAIQVLASYIREHPDDFNRAQQRLQRIVRIREAYNSLTNELLDTLTANPDDTEKILELIANLEILESSNNPQVRLFIARVREVAQFASNRNRLMRIFEAGRVQTGAGQYQQALQTYAGGLDIYRDEFFAAGYGEIIENRVRGEIAGVLRGIGAFPAVMDPLNDAAAELNQAARRENPESAAGLARIGAAYDRLVPAMDRAAAFYRDLERTAGYFDEQLAMFQRTDSSMGDRSFLSFASRLIQGNEAGIATDGMMGVVRASWDRTLSEVEASLAGLAARSYTAALNRAVNQEYGRAREGFELAGGYVRYPLALLDKRRDFDGPGNPAEQVLYDVPVAAGKAEDFLTYQSMNRAIAYLVEGTDLGVSFAASLEQETALLEAWLRNISSGAAGEAGGGRELLPRLLAEAGELSVRTDAEIETVRNYRNGIEAPRGTVENITVYLDNARSWIGDLQARIVNRNFEAALQFYDAANKSLQNRLDSRRAEYAEGDRLIQGIPRSGGSGGGEDVLDHYPAEGLALLTHMEQSLVLDLEWGRALLGQYRTEPRETFEAEDVQSLYAAAQTLVAGLESLREQGDRIAAAARNQAAQGEAFRIDGERLFLEARSALGRGNFDVARDRLQRATERFNASLAIQESPALRGQWDQLVALGGEINRLENEIVIRDVRNLVNNARTAYFAGDFTQAEDMLIRAQNRWQVTNVGADSEVQYWLSIVQSALSLQSGRTIPPTAPLYAEMSQLLSDARKNYEEGVRYFNANQRSLGTAKFVEARQKTQEVKLMFPVNQEAGILELQIDQITDPAAFNESFVRRFNQAVAGTKPNVRSLESFAELQNLAEINPRYPGMAAALVQAEIDMGLRPPPPNPRDLARSNELTAAARRILDDNVRSQFEIGLRQVDEALNLNPNNTQAMTIKDQLQTRMNGTGTLVIDSRSEEEYQRAVAEFQRGNYLVASAIVEQLLRDPKNRSSSRILELQRRIQSRL
jgi:hypothetical protein